MKKEAKLNGWKQDGDNDPMWIKTIESKWLGDPELAVECWTVGGTPLQGYVASMYGCLLKDKKGKPRLFTTPLKAMIVIEKELEKSLIKILNKLAVNKHKKY